MPVYFHTEDISFQLKKSLKLKSWIQRVIKLHDKKTGVINFILCSDEYLLEMNRKYLKHDYYTDIITFDQSDSKEIISGDIYISIDRVKDNARQLTHVQKIPNSKLETLCELYRVIIHGMLHLLGYSDKTASSKKKMRQKEDDCLKLI